MCSYYYVDALLSTLILHVHVVLRFEQKRGEVLSTLYMTISRLCEQRGISGYRLCRDIGIQPSILTDLKSGRKKGLAAETAQKIADYFGVTVGYLLGNEKEPVQTDEPNDEDIKFALFGGDGEITDEMFDEVKAF